MNEYLEFTISCDEKVKEHLIAELADADYEGFIELDNGFSAFIQQPKFNQIEFENLLTKYGVNPSTVPQSVIEHQNWNAQWEAGYEPIIIDDKIAVIAPFHEVKGQFECELIIKPKNTFGTGHHETTQLMLKMMLNLPFKNSHVLDYGCGTGVLGIMASKLGATTTLGIDIDIWSVENVAENIALNNILNFDFIQGNIDVIPSQQFDFILANINKNILLDSFSKLSDLMPTNAVLLISGFFVSDLGDLIAAANQYKLQFHAQHDLNNWCAAHFIKQ